MQGDGDFRSDEADIIVTNPPFSLFREFVAWALRADEGLPSEACRAWLEASKDLAVIGSQNAITYREIFPLLKENRLWLGATNNNEDMVFEAPEGARVRASNREKAARLGYEGDSELRA